MLEEIKKIKSGKKELKEFGLTVGIVFILISGFLLWKKIENYFYFFIIGLLLVIFGLFFTPVLKPLHKVWMMLALFLGYVMTRVILSILFYVIITPIGIFMKLIGNDLLDVNFNKKRESYWVQKDKNYLSKTNYEKQY